MRRIEVSGPYTPFKIGGKVRWEITCLNCKRVWRVEGDEKVALESSVRHEKEGCGDFILHYPKEIPIFSVADWIRLRERGACPLDCAINHSKEDMDFLGIKYQLEE